MLRAEFHRVGGPRGSGAHADVDRALEVLLKARLQALHPCRWNGEETRSDAIDGREIRVVDPNDGTREFLHGLRGSAISMALLRDRKPVLGVVFAPVALDDHGDLIVWAEGARLARSGEPEMRTDAAAPGILALNANAADYADHNCRTMRGFRVRALPGPAYVWPLRRWEMLMSPQA